MLWIGIAAAFAGLIGVALYRAVWFIRYHRSLPRYFADDIDDWRSNTIAVEIALADEPVVIAHCRSQGFTLRTEDNRILRVPPGLDMQAEFSDQPRAREIVLAPGTRCALYLSTLQRSGLRIRPHSYLVLHEPGWTPYAWLDRGSVRWDWRTIALCLALPATIVPLVALNPEWTSLAVLAVALCAYDLFLKEETEALWLVRVDY